MSNAAPATATALAADSRSLDATRRLAQKAPEKALRDAAQQFEALFMNMLLKSMRESLPREDPLASDSTRLYTGMLDQQLGQNLSGRGLGLADMLVKQLGRSGLMDKLGAANAAARRDAQNPFSDRPAVPGVPAPGAPGRSGAPSAPAAPSDFVRRMAPHAAAAEREYGIPAHFSMGQAALESGWGRREIRAADGTPSHNLFGIKAGRGWSGPTVEIATTEYVNGVPRGVKQSFRVYGSYEDAFRDHARLISSNPRYAQAREAQGDAAAYARAVRNGGYATDPAYAEKLTQVINRTLSLGASA